MGVGYHNFPSKSFCFTAPKYFIGEHFGDYRKSLLSKTFMHRRGSSRRVNRAGGGGEWKTPFIKIGYSEPRGVFHPSRELSGDVILDFDGLTTRVM